MGSMVEGKRKELRGMRRRRGVRGEKKLDWGAEERMGGKARRWGSSSRRKGTF